MRFGKWKPIKNSSLSNFTAIVLAITQEEIMVNAENTIAKK